MDVRRAWVGERIAANGRLSAGEQVRHLHYALRCRCLPVEGCRTSGLEPVPRSWIEVDGLCATPTDLEHEYAGNLSTGPVLAVMELVAYGGCSAQVLIYPDACRWSSWSVVTGGRSHWRSCWVFLLCRSAPMVGVAGR